jgi:hypothetical protein
MKKPSKPKVTKDTPYEMLFVKGRSKVAKGEMD